MTASTTRERTPSVSELRMLPPTQRIILVQLESILGRIGLLTVVTILLLAIGIASSIAMNVIGTNDGAITWALLPYFAIAQGIATPLAALFPGAVWDGLPPDRRGALHTLPLDRKRHELLRVLAGALIIAAAVGTLYAIALLMHTRLLPTNTPLPRPSAFYLSLGSLSVAYLLATLGGLVTRSATGNILRMLVYGFLIAMVVMIFGERFPGVAAVYDWIIASLLGGRWGVGSALFAGLNAFNAAAGKTVYPSAVLLWLAIAAVLVWLAAGRLPRSGRG